MTPQRDRLGFHDTGVQRGFEGPCGGFDDLQVQVRLASRTQPDAFLTAGMGAVPTS